MSKDLQYLHTFNKNNKQINTRILHFILIQINFLSLTYF